MCARRGAPSHVHGDIATYWHIHTGDGGGSIIYRSTAGDQAAGFCHFGDETADFKLPITLMLPLKALFQKHLLIPSARDDMHSLNLRR